MSKTDPITEALMAPGAPFEVIDSNVKGRSIRVFKNAPGTLMEIINKAREYGDTEFIVAGDRRFTYDEFFSASDCFSYHLIHEHGVEPGQSVAICMKNSPEWMMSFVAVLQAGGVAVLVNSRGTAATMQMAIEDTDTVLVLADDKRREALMKVCCKTPIITVDAGKLAGKASVLPKVERQSDDPVAMFFTSGTTGRAKAAVMSNRALVTGTMNTQLAMAAIFRKMAAAYNMDIETLRTQMPQTCSLVIFPLFHTSGCSAIFLTTLLSGGKLVLMDRWSPEEALRLIEKERVTSLGGVPATHWDVLRAETIDDYDLSSLVSISVGGQAFPRNLMTALKDRFPNIILGTGYGMTETAGSISQATGEALVSRPTASGPILDMLDVRITGEDGEEKPLGETGEIWAKGATVMSEYYGRPEDTVAAFDGEWFKTGDVGFIDEDGYIYIVDRKTDMVISGGENIYCVEVEAALSKHPSVLQVCTFGVPDDRLGERLIACFVPTDTGLEPHELREFAGENLAAYRIPREFVRMNEPFELNALSKIMKRKVRESFLAGDFS